MPKVFDERFEKFKKSWKERCERVREDNFSRRQCKNIHMQFVDEFYSLLEASEVKLVDSDIENKYRSLESEVFLALEEANSNFEMEHQPWYAKIFREIKLKIGLFV